jgi:hypothetical protein
MRIWQGVLNIVMGDAPRIGDALMESNEVRVKSQRLLTVFLPNVNLLFAD